MTFAIDVREKRFAADGRLVLADVKFAVGTGECVAVVGPSGCGKSTLLGIVAGIDHAFTGTVTLPAGARVGYAFQNPRLLPWRSVRKNIELVLEPARADTGVAERLLEAAGLAEAADKPPGKLSVGMARRVGLLRALAVEPDVLLLDEPFVSLDPPTAQRMGDLVVECCRGRAVATVLVTHDLAEAARMAERIVLLSAAPGRLLMDLALDPAERGPAGVNLLKERIARAHPELVLAAPGNGAQGEDSTGLAATAA